MLTHESLQLIPLFKEFSDEELILLLPLLKPKEFLKDEVVIKEGELGDQLYLIKKGAVTVTRIFSRGEQKVIARLEAGEVFGEMSFIDRKPRTASVKTAALTTVLILSRKQFDELSRVSLLLYAKLLREVATIITQRLRRMDEQVSNRVLWA